MASHKLKEILCILYSGLLFVSGLILIVVSCILCYRAFYHFTFIPGNTLGPLIVLFILGIVYLFTTWLGMNGPLRAHDVHVILFIVVTVILLLTELTIGIWSMVIWGEVSVFSVDLQAKSFTEMRENCNKKSWIKVQREFQCCGMHGFTDYDKEECRSTCIDSDVVNSTIPMYFSMGCQDVFVGYVKNILLDAAIIGFLATIYHVLGIFLFCIFLRSLKKERQKHRDRVITRQASASSTNQPGPDTPLVYSITPLDNPPPSSPISTTAPVTHA